MGRWSDWGLGTPVRSAQSGYQGPRRVAVLPATGGAIRPVRHRGGRAFHYRPRRNRFLTSGFLGYQLLDGCGIGDMGSRSLVADCRFALPLRLVEQSDPVVGAHWL